MKMRQLVEIQNRRRTRNSHDLEELMDEKARVGRSPRQEADSNSHDLERALARSAMFG